MYAQKKRLHLRSSTNFHDRMVFLDRRGWVVGQSIKDAAKKTTYMIEIAEPSLTVLRKEHENLWNVATVVI